MHRLLIKGNRNVECGRLVRAIRCYKKAIHKRSNSSQDKLIALYMLAYTHVLSDHQARHSEWSALGVDLKHPYFHAYDKAAHYLEQIAESQFSPEAYDLPVMDEFDWQHIKDVSSNTFAWHDNVAH